MMLVILSEMDPSGLVRESRRNAGLTQAELGAKLGRSQASIAALERPGSNPRVETLERVLRATGHRLDLGAREFRSSVDETLIASNLRVSPAARLERFSSWYQSLRSMTDKVRSAGGSPA
jgi:transcriptional regulator with XRE-family HTH domain